MEENKISLSDAFQFAWGEFKSRAAFYMGATVIVPLVIALPLIALIYFYEYLFPIPPTLFILVAFYFLVIFHLGLVNIAIRAVDGKEIGIGHLFSAWNLFLRYWVASILNGLIVQLGFLLLIVPGVIWFTKYYFYGYLLVDEDAGAVESISLSGEITSGYKLKIFVSLLALGLLIIVGSIFFFITLPIFMLAMAYIYRQLRPSRFSRYSFMQPELAPRGVFQNSVQPRHSFAGGDLPASAGVCCNGKTGSGPYSAGSPGSAYTKGNNVTGTPAPPRGGYQFSPGGINGINESVSSTLPVQSYRFSPAVHISSNVTKPGNPPAEDFRRAPVSNPRENLTGTGREEKHSLTGGSTTSSAGREGALHWKNRGTNDEGGAESKLFQFTLESTDHQKVISDASEEAAAGLSAVPQCRKCKGPMKLMSSGRGIRIYKCVNFTECKEIRIIADS